MRLHGKTFLSLALSLSRHARSACMSSTTVNPASRFQQLLDSVDVGSSPRIELLAVNGSNAAEGGLAVLDSSFNPPTRAHLYMLECAVRQLDLKRSLLRKLPCLSSPAPARPSRSPRPCLPATPAALTWASALLCVSSAR